MYTYYIITYVYILVGGLEHELYDFPYIGNFIIPTDELIFFRGVEPTNQMIYKSGQITTTSLFSLTGIIVFIGESSQHGIISG